MPYPCCCGGTRLCCPTCTGTTIPRYWTFTHNGNTYNLTLKEFDQFRADEDDEYRCEWRKTFSERTVEGCTVNAVTIHTVNRSDGSAWRLAFYHTDDPSTFSPMWQEVVAPLNPGRYNAVPVDCSLPVELTETSSSCGPVPSASITITPSEFVTLPDCCCREICLGDTPLQWGVTIGEQSWVLKRTQSCEWLATIAETEIDGVTVDHLRLEKLFGFGWRLSAWYGGDTDALLTWQLSLGFEGATDCESELTLPPAAFGLAGTPSEDAVAAPAAFVECGGSSSSGVLCCDASYYTVSSGGAAIVDGEGWTFTTGLLYTLLPDEPTEEGCTYTYSGNWTKTVESPQTGTMVVNIGAVDGLVSVTFTRNGAAEDFQYFIPVAITDDCNKTFEGTRFVGITPALPNLTVGWHE